MLGVRHVVGGPEPPDGEFTELGLGEPKVTVQVVELLLEAVQPIEVFVRRRPEGRHVCTVRRRPDGTHQSAVQWAESGRFWRSHGYLAGGEGLRSPLWG